MWSNIEKAVGRFGSRCLFILLLVGPTACKTPFDPTRSDTGGHEISIHYLKSIYLNRPVLITDDYVIRGRVVGSDEQGNFRWTLVVEDDTGGIEIKIGLNPYYGRFALGQEVRVKCAGLVLGAYGRTLQLGSEAGEAGYETGFISLERLDRHILQTGVSGKIIPTVLTPRDISMRYVDCSVRFDGLTVIEEHTGLTWGDGKNYVERRFRFADAPADTLIVRTSPQAVFAAEKLPTGTGSLEGVLTQFAGKYSLVLNHAPKF